MCVIPPWKQCKLLTQLKNGTIVTSFGTPVASRQIINSYLTISELHNASPDTVVPMVTQNKIIQQAHENNWPHLVNIPSAIRKQKI